MPNEVNPNQATPDQKSGAGVPTAASTTAKPAQPTQAAQSTKPVQSTKQVQGVKPVQPVQTVKAVLSPQSPQTSKPTQTGEAVPPAQVSKPGQPSRSSQPARPVQTATQGQAAATAKHENEMKATNWWAKATPIQRELALFVLLPTLLVFVYTAFLWSPMYVSETKFAVRSGTEQSYGVDIASQLLKTSNSSTQDAQVVEAYIRSPDIFEALDKDLKIIGHYSSSEWDWLSRLTSSPTLWDKQTFWNWVSKPVVNPDNGIVTYTVRAYEPAMAQAISQAVLKRSEALVNEMNERARKDTLALSEKEVEIAKDRVAKAQQALEEFRNQHRDLDPQATATGLQTIVFELEGERAKLRAEIEDAQSYMKASAPQLKNMQSRLAAIEKQLASEKARLVNQEGKDALNSWVSGYETLMIESEFAKKQLTTAMTAMETARASLLSKTRYIVPIEQPTLPDESRYPNPWIFTICTFLGLLLLYGLIRLIVASVREHAGF